MLRMIRVMQSVSPEGFKYGLQESVLDTEPEIVTTARDNSRPISGPDVFEKKVLAAQK